MLHYRDFVVQTVQKSMKPSLDNEWWYKRRIVNIWKYVETPFSDIVYLLSAGS